MGANTGHYDNHPAYRAQAYLIGKKVMFGENRTNIPNWEVEVSRGVPWFSSATLASDDRGVNPAGVLFDWLTDDRFGLGIPEATLDSTTWNATKTAIDGFRISPYITDQNDVRGSIAQLLTYFDGWLRRNGSKIELGYWQHGIIDTSGLPVLNDDDLTEEAELTHSGYGDTVNFVAAIYKDRLHYFHDTPSQPYTDRVNFDITGELRPTWVQVPWITDPDLANQYAAEYGKYHARPKIAGTLKVKRERVLALGLLPGALFVLDTEALGLAIVFRLTDLEWPADKETAAALTVENERSLGPTPYSPPAQALPGNFVMDAVEVVNYRVRELPSGLKSAREPQVVVLAQRPASHIVGFNTYVSTDDATFDFASGADYFAAYGKVTGSGAGYMDVELFGPDNIASQTATQQADGNLLGFFAGGVRAPIVSVGQVSALGAGIYRIYYIDELFGTDAATPAVNDKLYFLERAKVAMRFSNKNFAPGATLHFKLPTYTRSATVDLSGIASFAYTFGTDSAVSAPEFTPKVNPISIEDVEDAAGKLWRRLRVSWTFVGDEEISHFEVAISGTGFVNPLHRMTKAATFSIEVPAFGSWSIAVRAVNRYGEPSDYDDDPSTWQCTHGKGIVASVVAHPYRIAYDGSLERWDGSAWVPFDIVSTITAPVFEESPDGVVPYTTLTSKSYSTNFFFRVRAPAGSELYFTTDGSDPNPGNPFALSAPADPTFFVNAYTTVGFGTLSVTVTMRARAYSGVSGSNWSQRSDEVTVAIAYAPDPMTLPAAATPYFTRVSGTFGSGSVGLTIGCSTSGATIYYSTDGTSYTAYGGGTITVPLTDELHAYAEAPGFNTSGTASAYNDAGTSNPGRLPQ
jgi:hypothetical protein